MAYTTIPRGIVNTLVANWALAVGLTDANHINFDTGWVDLKQLRATNITAQVIVSGPIAGPIRYFGPDVSALGVVAPGLRLLTYHRYVVNIWVPIPPGDLRLVWDDYAEEIRFEVIRILNEQRSGFAAVPPGCPVIMFEIPLDAGRALHELDTTPRILRYEITFQVDTMS